MIKFINKLNCSPIACMTFYVIITTAILNFALTPVNKSIDEVKVTVEKVRDLLTIKPERIAAPGSSSISSPINSALRQQS